MGSTPVGKGVEGVGRGIDGMDRYGESCPLGSIREAGGPVHCAEAGRFSAAAIAGRVEHAVGGTRTPAACDGIMFHREVGHSSWMR